MEKCNIKQFMSSDTNVSKFVFEFETACVEAVLYRYGTYKARTVICCSTQCGCKVGCRFCGTGRKFCRNMTNQEIVYQVDEVLKTIDCKTDEIKKFQIMFMSMGEPFMNYNNLEYAIRELAEKYPNAQLLVSTSAPAGIEYDFGKFVKLSEELPQVGIQFSVHASTDEARKKLIPTDTCTLRQISTLGNMWAAFAKDKPYYNYCVHAGNSSDKDADMLVSLFDPAVWECTLSVICSADENMKAAIERQLDLIGNFAKKLTSRGVSLRVFNPAGQDDIGGGCGQLWYFQKWFETH